MNDSSAGGSFKMPSGLDDFKVLPETARYLQSIDAKAKNFRTAKISETWQDGKYYAERITIRFAKDGEVTAEKAWPEAPVSQEALAALLPDATTQAKIKAEWAGTTFPTITTVNVFAGSFDQYGEAVPEHFAKIPKETLSLFKCPPFDPGHGKYQQLLMVQQRIERDDGSKFYINHTPWTDGIWRQAEPDMLPLYGLERIKGSKRIALHEGTKGARLMHLLDRENRWHEHPWGDFLSTFVHVAWVGGALNPHRTDFSPLNQAQEILIVQDKDEPGRMASPELARQFRQKVRLLQFGIEFPEHHDLGDDFPESMFRELPDGKRHYIGPSVRSCLFPFTWLTNKTIPVATARSPNPKPIISLRRIAAEEVVYVSEQEKYLFREYPWKGLHNPEALNRELARRSDTTKVETLLMKHQRYQVTGVTYMPDKPTGIVSGGLFNIFVPSLISAKEGKIKPYKDYLKQLITDDKERYESDRWLCTLIAHPEIHMRYGILMWSIQQQVGKSLLAELILQPLIGEGNYSTPSEEDVTSKYNDWMVNKRLVIIDEIYQGESWKVYNGFKARMTQKEFRTSIKYQQPYQTINWTHFFATSNSRHALSIENADARWLIVHATEIRWGSKNFRDFIHWVKYQDGLAIIRQYAGSRPDEFYVRAEENAPITETKREMIRAKIRLVGAGYFYDLVQYWDAKADGQPKATSATKLTAAVLKKFEDMKDADPGKYAELKFATPTQLRNSVIGLGCSIWEHRMDIPGGGHDTKHFILLNSEATRKVAALVNEKGAQEANAEARKLIKDWWVKPETMMALMEQRAIDIKAQMIEDEPF